MRRIKQPGLRFLAGVGATLLVVAVLVVSAAVRLSAQGSSIERVSVNSAGVVANADSFFPAVSANGDIVGFKSAASNLDDRLPEQTQFDVFVRDRASGQTRIVSLTSVGFVPNDNSFPPALDDSGNLVAFASEASDMVPMDRNNGDDVFVRDRDQSTTEAVSLTNAGTLPLAGGSRDVPPSISGEGRYVAFETTSILVPEDPNTDIADVYVRDRLLGVTELISVRTVTRDPSPALAPGISGNGCIVAFVSPSDRLIPQGGDPNEKLDVYIRNRCSDPPVTSLITRGFNGEPTTRDSQSSLFPPALNDDGTLISYESLAINLVPDDTNNVSDVFVYDANGAVTERVSVNTYGEQGDGPSNSPSISGDGRYVVFSSTATNFVPGATGANIYVRDRLTNETCEVSLGEGLSQVSGDSVNPAISRDGHWIAFESTANLVPGGRNGQRDIYIVENLTENQLCPPTPTPTSTIAPPTNTPSKDDDCCQCEGNVCELPSDNGTCPEDCSVVFNAACFDGVVCATRTPTVAATPTRTLGPNDCCQCDGEACSVPSSGSCPESCEPQYDSACVPDVGCVANTPTPTLGPNDCCQCDGQVCSVPSSGSCPEDCEPTYDSACVPDVGCVANTPTPTVTPTRTPGIDDCCACPESCSVPSGGGCPVGCEVNYDSACPTGSTVCVPNTPTVTPGGTTPTNTPAATATATRTTAAATATATQDSGGGTPTPTNRPGTPTATRTGTPVAGGSSGGGCGCETTPQPRNMGLVALRDLLALCGPMLIWRLRRRRSL